MAHPNAATFSYLLPRVNDRIISVNGISLENVEYATAVQVLRDSGNTVTLVVRRRVPNHSLMQPAGGNVGVGMAGVGGGGGVGVNSQHQHQHSLSSTGLGLVGALGNNGSQQQIKVIVTKASKKDDFGIVLGCRLFIKVSVLARVEDSFYTFLNVQSIFLKSYRAGYSRFSSVLMLNTIYVLIEGLLPPFKRLTSG